MNFSASCNVEETILPQNHVEKNILEDLFTNVESSKSIMSFFTHHIPVWILLQRTILFSPEAFLFELWVPLASQSCLLFSNCWMQGVLVSL